jgi:integrase/recombinase XerC
MYALKINRAPSVEETHEDYLQWLARQPLSKNTKRVYSTRVRQYIEFLVGRDATLSKDFHARDYKEQLLKGGAKPSSVNACLTAIDSYYLFLGLDKVRVSKEQLQETAPRSLTKDEQKRLFNAIELCGNARNKALMSLLFYSGLRLSEVAALTIADAPMSANKGSVIVRYGKGGKYREVPLHKSARVAILQMLKGRGQTRPSDSLFVSRLGNLSARMIDHIVRTMGDTVGLRAERSHAETYLPDKPIARWQRHRSYSLGRWTRQDINDTTLLPAISTRLG